MDDYMTIKQAAEEWNITSRRVQVLCSEGRIDGAFKFGRDWAIPKNTTKPTDNRIKSGKYKNWREKYGNNNKNNENNEKH